MRFLRNHKMGAITSGNECVGTSSKVMGCHSSKSVPPNVSRPQVGASIEKNRTDFADSIIVNTKQPNVNEPKTSSNISSNNKDLNDRVCEQLDISENDATSTHQSPFHGQAGQLHNSINSPCDVENEVKSNCYPTEKTSSGVKNDTELHFDLSEEVLPSLLEQDFLRESQYNWGRKEVSNRKTRLYRRLCKGVYQCSSTVCGKKSRNNRKCPQCRSKLHHKPCPAKLYYNIQNDYVMNQRNEGLHTCRQFDKHQFSEHNDDDHDTVDKIPYDINGDVVLKVKIRDVKNTWENLVDGRNWGRYENSYTSTGEKVYVRKCIGRPLCERDDCPFYKKFHRRNTAQYEKVFSSLLCRECKSKMTVTHCSAKKTYVFSDHKPDIVVINHQGTHVCSPTKLVQVPQDEIKQLTQIFPSLKPSQVSNILIKQAIDSNSSPEDVSKVAAGLIDNVKIGRTTSKIRKELYPYGNCLTAVIQLKDSMAASNHDQYLIYHVNEEPPYVLTTSYEKIQMACQLSGYGDEIWPTYAPYAHIDFQPSRVCGMSTLGVQFFHPNLKESITLFKLYCKDELAPTVEYGLTNFSEAVRQFSKNECPRFDPDGWMSDESGAILAALETVYGAEIHTKLATCQYHFTMSVNRIKKILTPNSGQIRFADIAYSMENAATPDEYINFKRDMITFMASISNESHVKTLRSWLQWWDNRKQHWASAYRPTNNTPSNNLSESMHAAEKMRNSVNVQLVDAVKDDVSASFILKEKIRGYIEGHYTGGRGKSLIDLDRITKSKQKHRAANYAKNLKTRPRHDCDVFAVEPSATHREDKFVDLTTGNVQPRSSEKRTDTKKPRLHPQKTEPRPCKRRCNASSLFLKVKNTAIREYDNYSVIPDDSNGDSKKSKNFIVCNNVFFTSNDYVVNIAAIPTCACPYYMENKNKQICKHIVIVLLSLGVDQNDALLFQVGYTPSELENLLNSCLRTFTKQPQVSQQGVRRKHIFYLGSYLKGNRPGRRTGCAHCKRQLNDGLVVEIDGKYRYAQNSFNKTFMYCLNDSCLKNPPRYSDIKFMPTTINGGYSNQNEIDEAKQLITLSII